MHKLVLLVMLTIISYLLTVQATNGLFSHADLSSNSFSTSNRFSQIPSTPPTEPTIAITLTPTPFVADHIVISEVQISGSNASQDFIELYNPTSVLVDLNGWKLRKRISTGGESSLVVITAGKSIPPHGFFLWANSAGGYSTTIAADVSNSNTISVDNSIVLLTPDDTIVDRLSWGSGVNQFVETLSFVPYPAAHHSMERKAYMGSSVSSMVQGGEEELKGNGFDSDNNAGDFILRTTSQPQNSISTSETP